MKWAEEAALPPPFLWMGEIDMLQKIADAINLLGRFCGLRDVPELSREALRQRYGVEQADVMVLIGGSILCGGDVVAEAMRSGAARRCALVGGAGHTTQCLRDVMAQELPGFQTEGLPEARLFAQYLKIRHGLEADFLECDSTNCGNNITFLLDLLRKNAVKCDTMILTQDSTMQLRTAAVLWRQAPEITVINYAPYVTEVDVRDGKLAFRDAPRGMWTMERYLTLLMGEIPRLRDDAEGYGPRGRGFIAHVDMPEEVERAFEFLRTQFPEYVRAMNPKPASK